MAKRKPQPESTPEAAESAWTDRLRRVRLRHGLDKPEAAAIFLGLSVRMLYYYQSGGKEPPEPIRKLIILLDNHPELFEEID